MESKHTAVSSPVALRKLTATAALIGAMALISGCSGDVAGAGEGTTSSAEATPSSGFPTTEVIKTATEEYLQTTIDESDPAVKIDPKTYVNDATDYYTIEEIEEAQELAARFVAEEYIDSAVNGGGQTMGEWIEEHKNLLRPALIENLTKQAEKGTLGGFIVHAEDLTEAGIAPYSYAKNPDGTRLVERSIIPTYIGVTEEDESEYGQYISFKFHTTWEMKYEEEFKGEDVAEGVVEVGYSLQKNPDTGEWQFIGWSHEGSKKFEETKAPEPQDIPTAGVVSTPYGEYLQSTIDESDPAMKVDPTTMLNTGHSAEDLADGQQFLVRFIAEEVIDSPVNGGGQTPSEWIEEHKAILGEDAMPDLLKQAKEEEFGLLMTSDWMKEEAYADYRYIYSPTETRVKARTITPTEVYGTATNGVVGTFEVEWTMALANGEFIENKKKLTLGVESNPATGTWQLTGWEWSTVD